LKDVVNEAIRRGLDAINTPQPKQAPFRTQAVDLGPFLFSSIREAIAALDEEYDRKKLGLP
jgi:hypothetical protein